MRDPFLRNEIFCPGPTPVPETALHAATQTRVYHRNKDFSDVFLEARSLLRPIFGSQKDPLILTSSGTGGMECLMSNLTDSGDVVVVIEAGKFGERWRKMAQRFACDTRTLNVEWGEVPSPEAVVAFVGTQRNVKALFFQANETSTGVQFPVQEIAAAVRQKFPNVLICVDAISSLCAHSMKMADWDLDGVVSGSQKGFGVPPGLAFVALSERAVRSLSKRPRFYFDYEIEAKNQIDGKSAWTPATTLVFSLQAVLREIEALGIDLVVRHHERLGEACRAAVKAMGLQLYAKSSFSNALTAIDTAPLSADAVGKTMKSEFGALVAGGQDQVKDRIIRLSHLGFVSRFHLLHGISALEFSLARLGHSGTLGAGTQAAMQVLARA